MVIWGSTVQFSPMLNAIPCCQGVAQRSRQISHNNDLF